MSETSGENVRARRPAKGGPTADLSKAEGGGIGVLDVVKAIAPLLIIIALALGMLILGYLFLPETLSPPSVEQPVTSSSVESAKKEAVVSNTIEEDEEITACSELFSVKDLILALDKFSKWRELGSKLGMSEQQLRAIEAENKDTELQKRAMLRAWYDSQSHKDMICWYKVIDALIMVGEHQLAKKIALDNDVIFV